MGYSNHELLAYALVYLSQAANAVAPPGPTAAGVLGGGRRYSEDVFNRLGGGTPQNAFAVDLDRVAANSGLPRSLVDLLHDMQTVGWPGDEKLDMPLARKRESILASESERARTTTLATEGLDRTRGSVGGVQKRRVRTLLDGGDSLLERARRDSLLGGL